MATVIATSYQDSLNALSQLASLVSDSPEQFLRPTSDVQQVAIQAAKGLLDPLATNIIHAQSARREENRKKRKRGEGEEEQSILQVRQVYIKGFGVKQIWEQAKRILDVAQQEVGREVQQDQHNATARSSRQPPSDDSEDEDISDADLSSMVDGSGEEDEGIEGNPDDMISDEESDEDLAMEDDGEPEEDIEADSDLSDSSDAEKHGKRDIFMKDPNGLNDGFFSIDDFNKQSQFLEQMDARGDDDNLSDEDEIDWDANPLAANLAKSNRQRTKDGSADDNETSDEEDGPTFGNADLDASEDEDEDMVDEDADLDGTMGGVSNANEIRYAEFFEPPPQKPSKTKRMRALPKTQPPPKPKGAVDQNPEVNEEQLQNDLERAMADVRRDLLDSEEEDLSDEDEDEGDSENDIGLKKPKKADKNMSTHEKQRATIATEIRRLEAANVAKRDWQLSGEARAADRPMNSLIEEDLEFERTGKPIAPVTAETSEEIDALIKRRILAREFDEVVRRVPTSLNLASDTRRGRIEIDDAKPQASLGEIYEAEHQKNADPLSYIDKRSAAVKKQHAEIDILWKQVREQLDVLSNMHFKPKRADIEIRTVEDKPRIAMEDARPVGELESGEGGMLAPQEVYRPGVDSKGGKDEIKLQSGASMSREEMSREEKLRRRRREKERSKKAQTNKDINVLGKKKSDVKLGSRKKVNEAEKANIIEDLKRGGVKLVGKGGELQSIGKQKKGKTEGGEVIASNLKL